VESTTIVGSECPLGMVIIEMDVVGDEKCTLEKGRQV
jgi:hypothetical protein